MSERVNIESIELGKNTYRLHAPDSISVVVERQVTIDPTKAPNWKTLEKKGADPRMRTEWREPKHYSTLEAALKSLIDRAARDSGAETLAELVTEIKQYKRQISVLMSVEGN